MVYVPISYQIHIFASQILSTADPSDEREIVDALDWVLPTFDPELMEPQTLDEEVKRLEVLQSYMVLDQDREEAFDRITQLASRVFNVPVAVINLIDLGRLWLLSTNGLGDIRECPRKVTFCACMFAVDSVLCL